MSDEPNEVASPESKIHPNFTPRHTAILDLLSQGFTQGEVAMRLGLSPEAVGQMMSRAYLMMGVNNVASAVRKAMELGIIGSGNASVGGSK